MIREIFSEESWKTMRRAKGFARQNLFLCHSSHDDEAVAELCVHLNPLFDSGAVRIWEDSMLYAGERWDPAIRSQMRRSVGVIFLVSPHLLESPYVRDVEIPGFLRQAEKSKLKIYSLYLSHTVVEEVEFLLHIDGTRIARRLTEYQGLNSPADPLCDNRRNRARILAAAAKRVFADQ